MEGVGSVCRADQKTGVAAAASLQAALDQASNVTPLRARGRPLVFFRVGDRVCVWWYTDGQPETLMAEDLTIGQADLMSAAFSRDFGIRSVWSVA